MTNMRVVADNVLERAITLSASSTYGTLAVDNLLTDIKSEIWRAATTTATLTTTWSSGEILSMAALPFCNFTSTATMRIRLYSNTSDTTPALDTGVLTCCTYTPLSLWGWGTQPLGTNAYSFGGGAYAVLWFATTVAKKMVVDIADTGNALGYIEAARLVAGTYWESSYNPDSALQVVVTDASKNSRNDGGDVISNLGYRSKTLTINLPIMSAADRNSLHAILRNSGTSKPLFISVFPSSSDTDREQIYQMYCKLTSMQALSNPFADIYSAPLSLEEI